METSFEELHIVFGVVVGELFEELVVKDAECFGGVGELVVACVIRVGPLLFVFFTFEH
jgi:hypothetical protein